MTEPYESLAGRLDEISEEIGDAAMAELKEAVRRGHQKRPASERALSQARRAVDKAAHLLRHIETADSDTADSEQFD